MQKRGLPVDACGCVPWSCNCLSASPQPTAETTVPDSSTDAPTDAEPLADALIRLSGTPLDEKRLREVIAAYAPIHEEIIRLRKLDLSDVHPAVIFEPTAAWRNAR
jgi:hypothetical protein